MTIKLTTPIRREIDIDGEPFTVVITKDGVRLTRKRFRGGQTFSWKSLRDASGLSASGPTADRLPGTPGAARRIQ